MIGGNVWTVDVLRFLARSQSSLDGLYTFKVQASFEERSSASSSRQNHEPFNGLNSFVEDSPVGWIPQQSQADEWLQYDGRKDPEILEGNMIQQCPDGNHILSYSCSCTYWNSTEVFILNPATNETVFQLEFSINQTMISHYVTPTLCPITRLYPKTWNSDICVIWKPLYTFSK